jgi:hypothetical protein
MTINLEPDPARIAEVLRQDIGVDPNDAAIILNLATIGITNGAWRNSPVEDWHADGRIHDGGMLRSNVATTKLVLEVLNDHLGKVHDEGEVLLVTEDLADVDSDLSDELFLDIFERLSDPDRELPDGRTQGCGVLSGCLIGLETPDSMEQERVSGIMRLPQPHDRDGHRARRPIVLDPTRPC